MHFINSKKNILFTFYHLWNAPFNLLCRNRCWLCKLDENFFLILPFKLNDLHRWYCILEFNCHFKDLPKDTMIQNCTKKVTVYAECMEREQRSTHLIVAKQTFITGGITSISTFLANYRILGLSACLTSKKLPKCFSKWLYIVYRCVVSRVDILLDVRAPLVPHSLQYLVLVTF